MPPSPNLLPARSSRGEGENFWWLYQDAPLDADVKRTEVEWRLDRGSTFTGFGAGAQAAVSVRDFAKLFPLTVQSRIGFEPPFDCPRFVPSRSIGYFVGRQDA